MTSTTIVHIGTVNLHVPSPGVLLQSEAIASTLGQVVVAPTAAPAGTVIDQATGLMWTQATVATDKTWAEAVKAAAAVDLGGFTDWRLPTRKELLTLVDDTRFNPAINTDLFQCDPSRYWSSTVDAESPSDYAWYVLFDDGCSFLSYQDSQARVRAVRSVSPSASGQ
jgi:hypothetical protein